MFLKIRSFTISPFPVMQSRASCVVGLALLSLAAGIRKSVKTSVNATVELDSNCESLADIEVDGKNFGKGFEIACKHWPAKLGQFPINDITRARELAGKAMGPGGTLEQIKGIRETRAKREFCWRNETMRTVVASNCEMNSRGVCYGSCPAGHKPGLLKGFFSPTCTTICKESTRKRSCGFGCAKNIFKCARTVLDQAAAVASGVGAVYSFVTGNSRIAKVAEAVIAFAEFLLSVLPLLMKAVKGGIDIIKDKEQGLMMVISLFQYVQEVAPEIGETVTAIRGAFNELADLMADLGEAKRLEGALSVGRIVRDILDHGEAALDHAVTISKAFSFEKCRLA